MPQNSDTPMMPRHGPWWQLGDSYYELFQALGHFALQNPDRPIEACDSLFKGLNVLWTCRRRNVPGAAEQNDIPALHGLLVDLDPSTLLRHPAVAALGSIDPPVLNHNDLKSSPHYRPGQEVPAQLRKEAADGHEKFIRALERWVTDPSEDHTIRAVKKLAAILYIVRSNIMHGEKTPTGPDRTKADRDRRVCSIVKPVLDHIIELLLDRPRTKLAAYGTLLPGGQNAAMLDGIEGYWSDGYVEAVQVPIAGMSAIRLQCGAPQIPVSILVSGQLPDRWPVLDRFEGASYRRCLAPIRCPEGRIIVANIYAAAADKSE